MACISRCTTTEVASLTTPLTDVCAFVKDITTDAHFYMGNEKRTEARYAVLLEVNAFAINHSYEQTGQEFRAVTRDISTRGISLLTAAPVNEKWLALELTVPGRPTTRTVMQVLRCRPAGPFFEVAGEFVSQLEG